MVCRQSSLREKKNESGKNRNWEKRTKVFRMILIISSSRMRMGRRTESTSKNRDEAVAKEKSWDELTWDPNILKLKRISFLLRFTQNRLWCILKPRC